MSKEPHETHDHDSSTAHGAHDDHGHGHGHGDDAGEIIPEGSPSDFMLNVLTLFAAVGFVVFCGLMVDGVVVPHVYPNAGPGMYVGGAEGTHQGHPAESGAGEEPAGGKPGEH